ncbi:MFS transporter [Streptococcus hillyeri]|uniref:MFS transporter n=1 Tax=Streptococcus hillyeri TaxID=2282420 RepID=A0A3L9DYC4_9STRE|nr:MFS transporter [Streptococcus hillyeri]RLY05298.1 MFS transporter [Streptococcus hillyeri]
MMKILKNKLFMWTYLADTLSNFGDVVYYLALMDYVLQLPNAPLAISLVTVSETLPYLTMLIMAVWADQTKDKVNRILGTQFFRVSLYVVMGLVMGFSPALWIVGVAILINILSDLSGQYENALYTPISLRVIPREDRETLIAFRQGSRYALQLVFQSLGALLVTLLGYQQLAFLNAGTFFLSFVIMCGLRPFLQNLLEKNPIQMPEEAHEDNIGQIRKLLNALKNAVQTLKESSSLLRLSLICLTGLNAISAAQTPLILFIMSQNKDFVLGSSAMTLALLSSVAIIGVVTGSVLTRTLFKETSLHFLLIASAGVTTLCFLGLFGEQIVLVLVFQLISRIMNGVMMPKLQTMVFNSIPEHQLATVGAGIDTMVTLGMVFTPILLSGMILVLPARFISVLFVLLSTLLLGYTFKEAKKI